MFSYFKIFCPSLFCNKYIFFYWLYTHTQLKSLQGSLKFSKKHYTKCKQSILEMTLVLFIYSLWLDIVLINRNAARCFLIFSIKSWSNWNSNDSFGICSSWRFRNTPWMLNLMKFWLRYCRLNTICNISKSTSFYLEVKLKICIVFNFRYLSQNLIKFNF